MGEMVDKIGAQSLHTLQVLCHLVEIYINVLKRNCFFFIQHYGKIAMSNFSYGSGQGIDLFSQAFRKEEGEKLHQDCHGNQDAESVDRFIWVIWINEVYDES